MQIMPKPFSLDDLSDDVRKKIYLQNYSQKKEIEGVKIIKVECHLGDDGDFSEILKFNEKQEPIGFPGFKIAQLNRSSLFPGAIKAWHLHFQQNEIWYVPSQFHLVVGLWDIRKNSRSSGVFTKLVLGGSKPSLLYIPTGVAHGAFNNFKETAGLLYIVDNVFIPSKPDEYRLPWDALGSNFWLPEKD